MIVPFPKWLKWPCFIVVAVSVGVNLVSVIFEGRGFMYYAGTVPGVVVMLMAWNDLWDDD